MLRDIQRLRFGLRWVYVILKKEVFDWHKQVRVDVPEAVMSHILRHYKLNLGGRRAPREKLLGVTAWYQSVIPAVNNECWTFDCLDLGTIHEPVPYYQRGDLPKQGSYRISQRSKGGEQDQTPNLGNC